MMFGHGIALSKVLTSGGFNNATVVVDLTISEARSVYAAFDCVEIF